MDETRGAGAAPEVAPVLLSRHLDAPRALVFEAWSSADHLKRWFSPKTYTVPDAEVDLRPGGVFAVCMRSPGGEEHWLRGHFLEVSPFTRLAFTAHTTVTFDEEGAGTRMTVHQAYAIHDVNFLGAVHGAPEGWRTTLDKFEREVARIDVSNRRGVAHDEFTIERRYQAAPARVFHALTDPQAKARWFGGGEGYQVLERTIDVRPGGREHLQGRWAHGVVSTFDAVYHDVVADRRLLYSYEMRLDERKISVSLATVELYPQGGGTRLIVTEQGAFLDGYDDAGSRERGTGFLLDRLAQALA